MSAIVERAKAHYAGLERRKIAVPEWGGDDVPLVITWSALTVAERRKIYATDDDGRAPSGGIVMVRAIIEKACDEGGKKLFDAMAEHDLTYHVDAEVIGKIGNAILYSAGLGDKKGRPKGIVEQKADAKNG